MRTRLLVIVFSAVLAGSAIVAADLVTQPIPMPAGGAITIGWLGFWLRRSGRTAGAIGGGVIGAALGVVMHAGSHIVEDRVGSAGSLMAHVSLDAAISLAIAAAALLVALGPPVFVSRRLSAGRLRDHSPSSSSPPPSQPFLRK